MLYRSASGREVNHASSSSLDTFRLCRRKFKLSRIDGWKQKDRKASLEFGKCLESAIQFYHQNSLKSGSGIDEFKRLWVKWSEQPLVYTDQEGNWGDLYIQGSEMLRLYEIFLPDLPIKNPKFQLQFLKPLWPGSDLGELEFMAYVDMLSTLEDGTRIITDIKTAKNLLPVSSGMIALDGQLRKYAWVSGIRDVSFLNFVKCRPDDFKKGTNVTLLIDLWEFKAGQSLEVWKSFPPTDEDPKFQLLVGTDISVQLMDETTEAIKGKGSTEAKAKALQDAIDRGEIFLVERADITKTRLQYVRGTIPEEDLIEIGQQIGSDMISVKQASESDGFFKDGGVRFPNAICGWCEMLPICNKNDQRRDETLVQIKPKSEVDWLADLEVEETE